MIAQLVRDALTSTAIAFATFTLITAAARAQSPSTSPGTFGTVNAKPFLSIGLQDGAEPYQLHRVYGATRLPDGRIVIANSGTQQLRVFDAKGHFLRNVGGRGGGPGEFGMSSSLRLYRFRDSVLALDESANRVHVFDSQLKFAKTRLFSPVQSFPLPFTIGAFDDGSLLVMAYVNGGALHGAPGTVVRSQYAIATYSAAGMMIGKITEVEARPRFVMSFANAISYPFVPLIAEPLQTVVDNEIFVLRGSRAELEVFDRAGKLVRTLKWPAPTTRSATLWKAYTKADLATMTGQMRAKYEKFYTLDLPLPEIAPTYSDIVVDSEKRLWLKRYRVGRVASTWDVITTRGVWLGSVQTPARFTLYDVDKNFLLGRWLDDLDVEAVQLLTWTQVKK